ncbi:membrane hypothetical protein [Syntrophobacter sp. SbD1]|nr:membrane hypothetical protein [Syntrophobacter sp. SbD1]
MRELLRKLITIGYGKRFIIAKYLVSGTTAASVHLGLVWVLTHYLGVHYLLSSTIGFSLAVCVGFTLQKFWTFENPSLIHMPSQVAKYLGVGVTNLGINAIMMFILVDKFSFWYLFSQVIACGAVTFSNFVVYTLFIFKPTT